MKKTFVALGLSLCIVLVLVTMSLPFLMRQSLGWILKSSFSTPVSWYVCYEDIDISWSSISFRNLKAHLPHQEASLFAKKVTVSWKNFRDLSCHVSFLQMNVKKNHPLFSIAKKGKSAVISLAVHEGRCALIHEEETTNFAFAFSTQAGSLQKTLLSIFPEKEDSLLQVEIVKDHDDHAIHCRCSCVEGVFLASLIHFFPLPDSLLWNVEKGMIDGDMNICIKNQEIAQFSTNFTLENVQAQNAHFDLQTSVQKAFLDLHFRKFADNEQKPFLDQIHFEWSIDEGNFVFLDRRKENQYDLRHLCGKIRYQSLQDATLFFKGSFLDKEHEIPLLIEGSSKDISEKSLNFGLNFVLDPLQNISAKLLVKLIEEKGDSWTLSGRVQEMNQRQVHVIKHLLGFVFPAINKYDVELQSLSSEVALRCKKQAIDKVYLKHFVVKQIYVQDVDKEFAFHCPYLQASTVLDYKNGTSLSIPFWSVQCDHGHFELMLQQKKEIFDDVTLFLNVKKDLFHTSKVAFSYNKSRIDLLLEGDVSRANIHAMTHINLQDVQNFFPTLHMVDNVSLPLDIKMYFGRKDQNWRLSFLAIAEKPSSLELQGDMILSTSSFVPFDVPSHIKHCRFSSGPIDLEAYSFLAKVFNPYLKVSGNIAVSGEYKDGFLEGTFTHEKANLEFEDVVIQLDTKGSQGKGEFFFDPSFGFRIVSYASSSRVLEKNTQLVFDDISGFFLFEKEKLLLQNAKSFCHGVAIEGDFSMDFRDSSHITLSLMASHVKGNFTSLRSLLAHIEDNRKGIDTIEGFFEGWNQPFTLQMIFEENQPPQLDWQVHLHCHDMVMQLPGNYQIVRGRCEVHSQPQKEELLFFHVKGDLLYGSNLLCNMESSEMRLDLASQKLQFDLAGWNRTFCLFHLLGTVDLASWQCNFSPTSKIAYLPFTFNQSHDDFHLAVTLDPNMLESLGKIVEQSVFGSWLLFSSIKKGQIQASSKKIGLEVDLEAYKLYLAVEKQLQTDLWDVYVYKDGEKRASCILNSTNFIAEKLFVVFDDISLQCQKLELHGSQLFMKELEVEVSRNYAKTTFVGNVDCTLDIKNQSLFLTTNSQIITKAWSEKLIMDLEDVNVRCDFHRSVDIFRGKVHCRCFDRLTSYTIEKMFFDIPSKNLSFTGEIENLQVVPLIDLAFLEPLKKWEPYFCSTLSHVTVSGNWKINHDEFSIDIQPSQASLMNIGPIKVKNLQGAKKHGSFHVYSQIDYFGQPLYLSLTSFGQKICAYVDNEQQERVGELHYFLSEQLLNNLWVHAPFLDLQIDYTNQKEKLKEYRLLMKASLEKWKPYVSDDIKDLIEEFSLNEGLCLQGVCTLEENNNNALDFFGKLFGQDFDAVGCTLQTLACDVIVSPQHVDLRNFFLHDPSMQVHIKEVHVFTDDKGLKKVHIPDITCKNIWPSRMRKKETVMQDMLDPFILRYINFHDIEAHLEDLTTIRGRGTAFFTNFSEKKTHLLKLPLELIKRIGLDLSLLVPVRGEVEFILRGPRVELKRLKNCYSENDRSYFYLSNRRSSFIDFTGDMNITIKMKQHVLFKLTELFSISISGNTSKPIFSLK